MSRQMEAFKSRLVASVRTSTQSLWNRWGLVTIVAFTLWCLRWEFHIPSPAKAATVLAVLSAIMALSGDANRFEKVTWVFLLFAYLIVELTAIDYKDYQDEDLRRKQRAEEGRNFKRIGEGIQQTISQSEKQFEATAAGLNNAIAASTQAMKNTQPRGHIVWNAIGLALDGKPLQPNVEIPINVSWSNAGLSVATNAFIDGTTFVGRIDDKADQEAMGKQFDSWWNTHTHQPLHDIQPMEPNLSTLHSQRFSEEEVARLNADKTLTIYVLVRWVYSDRTGRWIRDDCFGYQDPRTNLFVTHPARLITIISIDRQNL